MIADFLFHGLEDLLSDVLLTQFIEIQKVHCPKFLLLGVLTVSLLPVFAHPINILSCILTDAWIVLIRADNNVSTVPELGVGMQPTTAKALPCLR